MEKIINIDGRDIKLKVNGGFLIKYKTRYKRDALQDIMKIFENVNSNELENLEDDLTSQFRAMQSIDIEIFYRILHMMAKTGNPDITDDVEEWCCSFDNLPVFDLMEDIIELFLSSMTSDIQKKRI